jgi:acetyl esterase/lipase
MKKPKLISNLTGGVFAFGIGMTRAFLYLAFAIVVVPHYPLERTMVTICGAVVFLCIIGYAQAFGTSPHVLGARPFPTRCRSNSVSLLSSTSSSSTSNEDSEMFRKMRATWPLWLQYFLRDSGALRAITDASVLLGVRPLAVQYPSALPDFLHLSGLSRRETPVKFSSLAYGSDKRQVIHLWNAGDASEENKNLVVFVHGGAWGSGFPLLYRLVAKPFLDRNTSVAIVGYRTYPTTNVQGQVDDIDSALAYIGKQHLSFNDVTLIGHSSGAHISLMSCLWGKSACQPVDRFIGVSGVYDIPSHYVFERQRGVERISPMAPACGRNLSKWKEHSPTRLIQHHNGKLPPILILHGDLDTTVPVSSSAGLVEALHSKGSSSDSEVLLKVLQSTGHAETVLEIMFGGQTQDLVMSWIKQQQMEQRTAS